MKYLFIGLCLCVHINAFTQDKTIADFYDTYTNHEDVLDVKLQGWLLQLAADYQDEKEKERILNSVSFLRVLIMSEGNLIPPNALKKFIRNIKRDAYTELIQIRNEGTLVDVFIREDGDKITDVLAVINEPGEAFILLSLEGQLDFKDLNNLHINIEGIEHLKKNPEQRQDIPRA